MDTELEALIWAIASARDGSSGSSGRLSSGAWSSGGRDRGPTAGGTQVWTPDALLAALDQALPDAEHGQQSRPPVQQQECLVWSDSGSASGHGGLDSNGLASLLQPALVAPASNLHPPSSSLAWTAPAAPQAVMGSWPDAGDGQGRVGETGQDSSNKSLASTVSSMRGPVWQHSPVLLSHAALSGPAAEPGPVGAVVERLMGPLAAEGPALASRICAAAGVAWLPQPQHQVAGGWSAPSSSSAVPTPSATPAAVSLSALDPALEWALAVLSTRVSPAEPPAADVRLANRTFAAHARRAGGIDALRAEAQLRPLGVPGASAAGGQAQSEGAEALPWQALQPLLAAVGSRLSPCSALTLLQVLVRQVGRSWRQQQPGDASSRPLPARQQQQVAATCQALFAAALRRPEQLPRATAAGLLVVMRRLQLHSPPTCALLVERLLASGPGRVAGAGSGLAAVGTSAAYSLQPSSGRTKPLRLAMRGGDGDGQGRVGASAVPPLRLSWAAMALSSLAQLRVPAEALPRRAVTRLFRSAVAPANRRSWTPALAAALLVWAARLHCRPPAAALKQYMTGLMEVRVNGSRLVLRRRRRSSDRSMSMGAHGSAASAPPAATLGRTQPGCSLLSRMRGPQLMAVLEALWRLYGQEASPQAAAAAAAVGGGGHAATSVSGPPHRFQRRVAAALMGRLHQLHRQQLCRLPLLLARLGLSSLRRPEHLRSFSVRVQQVIGGCDALDALLLLRGLAAEARAEVGAGGMSAPGGYCSWQRGELADVALRRYTVLMSTASPRLSAAALHAMPALWPQPDAVGVANASAATTAHAPAGSAEVDLQRRRAADTACERQWLLQQLDDHLAQALAAEARRLGQAASAGGKRAGRKSGKGSLHEEREAATGRMVLQVLESHVALRRRPSPRLQAALEAAVVAVAAALGTSGCARVRAAYANLGLSAGSRLSVALVTFG
ncbi:hypothetical protein HYH02_011431 [Chlamydomonas schloesseri]|uniref:Uncharacterized protein n=1 Tax=Chlamydomonas schloesseri TaxID=2026947 RepID=A0A835TAX4_9CHLO|nr:hypothetical protein HYH02_011431 [Chlamydomonas schloesseri]|eukprot:KAG2436999.1 hypothetical protein HYH02_011431 [Chlamydomonas schloesseri]